MQENIFQKEWLKTAPNEPQEGDYYIAVDPAGFTFEPDKRRKINIDNTAISIVKVRDNNWWISEIAFGRWTHIQVAKKILSLIEDYDPVAVGIESGLYKQAIYNHLFSLLPKDFDLNKLYELSHKKLNKVERIKIYLQKRFQLGYISLNNEGSWHDEFIKEFEAFPSTKVKDDLIDSLAFIEQLISARRVSSYPVGVP